MTPASQPSLYAAGLSPAPLSMKGKHWLEPKTLAHAHMRLATFVIAANVTARFARHSEGEGLTSTALMAGKPSPTSATQGEWV